MWVLCKCICRCILLNISYTFMYLFAVLFTIIMAIKKSVSIPLKFIQLVLRWCCSLIYSLKYISHFRVIWVIICEMMSHPVSSFTLRSDNVPHFTIQAQKWIFVVVVFFTSLNKSIWLDFHLNSLSLWAASQVILDFICMYTKKSIAINVY